jgi:hypothetical protein
MPVTKPDATKFDNANDSIAESRAELYTLVTSFNTIADEYNAGTLGTDTQLEAGTGITITQPDSAGKYTITNTVTGGITLPNTTITSINFGAGSTQTGTCIADVTNAFHCTGSAASTLNIECQNLSINGIHHIYIEREGVSGGLALNFKYKNQQFLTVANGTDSRFYRVTLLDTGREGSSAGNREIYATAAILISIAVND